MKWIALNYQWINDKVVVFWIINFLFDPQKNLAHKYAGEFFYSCCSQNTLLQYQNMTTQKGILLWFSVFTFIVDVMFCATELRIWYRQIWESPVFRSVTNIGGTTHCADKRPKFCQWSAKHNHKSKLTFLQTENFLVSSFLSCLHKYTTDSLFWNLFLISSRNKAMGIFSF